MVSGYKEVVIDHFGKTLPSAALAVQRARSSVPKWSRWEFRRTVGEMVKVEISVR